MQSEVHEIDPVTVRIEVEVPWDRVQKGLDATYGKLQKSAKIRGFRPGKVPRSVIKQLYGAQVKGEVLQTVVQETLMEAMREHDLAIVALPQVDDLSSMEDGAPLSFKATVEVRPKIESIDTALEVTRPLSSVSDAQVDEEIDRLRERHAEIVTPDPMRPAKAGDLLTVDYTVEIDGEEKPEMAAKERTIELASGRLLPEFEEGLTGKQPGPDEVQVRVAFGEDASDELKNKRALFRIKISDLREKVLPALDDELAKDLGEHETLEALRVATRKQLEDAAKARAESQVREQLVDKLVERNPVPIPPSMVAEQEKAMAHEIAYLMQMAGPSGQEFAAEMSKTLHVQAEKKVRAALVMGELARQLQLKVEPQDVEARLLRIAEQSGKHIAKVRVEMQGERREGLENNILEEKLLDYLLSQATVTDAPVGAAAGSPAGDTEAG
jgi:trigger factor